MFNSFGKEKTSMKNSGVLRSLHLETWYGPVQLIAAPLIIVPIDKH